MLKRSDGTAKLLEGAEVEMVSKNGGNSLRFCGSQQQQSGCMSPVLEEM